MTGLFLFSAIALIGVTVLLLLRPWQSGGAERDAGSVQDLNARIYRDQLAELDRDLAAGTLAPADHAQAGAELRRRLLQDTSEPDPATPAQARRTRRTSLVLAVAVPLAATGLYAWLGAPAALLPGAAQPQAAASHSPTAAEVDQMVAGLAARLEKNPNDPKGWSILARSYHALGRFAEAEAAFNRIGDDLNRDPVLLADYADTLASRAGGNLEGRPLQIVQAALKLDPDNAMALSLAAMGAFQRKDFAEAARHWQRLLPQLAPDSDEAKWVTKMLAQSGAAAPGGAAASGAAPSVVAANDTAAPRTPPAGGKGAAVTGSVSLAPKLMDAVKPGDTVFVFARPVDGGRMPLAVQRARVADLPLQFRLDDSLAISPQAKLSDASEVRIEARISRTGNATPSAGDLFGVSATVKTTGTAPVALQIDQVRP